ncbi:cell wall metabolism sensor histidine kinase WalK [Paenibacillus sp.]|uniref:cell wall metabolism sensor histidine kinase WalK n=1 Tax=Paenibacillus sp. TaxID=58172 RepID=UPI002D438395|nr:cell wall metabolism sensor histidine kinase WalK [Paenibacillus sp.]HZG84873.1 cell wall metabolism sensor histidine kinase WalK [Paenibacillus sp.]
MKGIRSLQTIQLRLIVIYVLLILIAMQLIGVYFIRTLEDSFYGNFNENLDNEAYLLADYVKDYLDANLSGTSGEEQRTYEDLTVFIRNLFATNDTEIQIIDANGIVVSASGQAQEGIVGQKNTQTEVNRALQGIRGNVRTMIDADGKRKRAVAMPVQSDGKVIGAVYLVASMEGLFDTMNRIKQFLFTGTAIALGLTAVLGIILANMITAPIKEITRKAAAIAVGNLNQRVNVLANDEIGQLGNAFNDMTQRLKQALSSIEEEKEKLASILSNMSDGVIATDEFGRTVVLNRSARAMLGIGDEDAAVGRDVLELLGLRREDVSEAAWTEGAVLNVVLTPDAGNGPLTARATFSPIHRRDHGVSGTVVLLHDVTEQEKLDASRKEFVANVSHELRTPLTTIKSYLEALDEGALEDRALAERFIGVTRNETERMIRLVNDLLHLSRFDSRQTPLTLERVGMAELLEEVSDRFAFQARQRGMGLSVELEGEDVPPVHVDRDAIDQVLDNLVSNAIKYSPDEGRVVLSARHAPAEAGPGWVEVTVRDWGIGIPKKDLHRIFERFYRVDKARSRNMGGTGLGLSIALEIVKAHGGTIRIESEPGQGTAVVFTLPAAPEEGESR